MYSKIQLVDQMKWVYASIANQAEPQQRVCAGEVVAFSDAS